MSTGIAEACLGLLASSWLGRMVDEGKVGVILPKTALKFECEVRGDENVPQDLLVVLNDECLRIERLPNDGSAVRCDKAERLYARERRENARKSVDVCVDMSEGLLLVECKYKARPDTTIVQSVAVFEREVAEKFRSTRDIWGLQTTKRIRDEEIVLFNAESKEKVFNMFSRLRLEDDARRQFANVRIMGTDEFGEYVFHEEQVATLRG